MSDSHPTSAGPTLAELLTLVVVSHNRPAYLRRALRYYAGLGCRVLVLDSSALPLEGEEVRGGSIDYRHVPDFGYLDFQAKLTLGVELAQTPNMAFAADDDYMLHDALEASARFLDAHLDYGLCHGYCLMYQTGAGVTDYFRRDKKGREDYDHPLPQQRVIDFMTHYIPPFYAVIRRSLLKHWFELVPSGTPFEYLEVGHAYFLLASAKARILPMPYIVREANYMGSEHNTDVCTELTSEDPRAVQRREAFAELLADLPVEMPALDRAQRRALAHRAFGVMAEGLRKGTGLGLDLIVRSSWPQLGEPLRLFAGRQYVEMPFYNQPFFDLLASIEYANQALPAGRRHLTELEGPLVQQADLLRPHHGESRDHAVTRLTQALGKWPFNLRVVDALLAAVGNGVAPVRGLLAWAERLRAARPADSQALLQASPSGQLLDWLAMRVPTDHERAAIAADIQARPLPAIGIVLLDLAGEPGKLQRTFDSLMAGEYRGFRIVVLTAGELPNQTAPSQVLHFVRVDPERYVDTLNLVVRESPCPWMLLARAGDEFTAAGLLRTALELRGATGLRAVSGDLIHRTEQGALCHAFRAGFNLDLLMTVPSLSASHWLIHRDSLIEVGGYDPVLPMALEYDLLLRLIEQGGAAGFAHLDEPLLIIPAPVEGEVAQRRDALVRHLKARGLPMEVQASGEGRLRLTCRQEGPIEVSILLVAQDNLPALKRCLQALLSHTRYGHYEIVLVDNASQSPEQQSWLDAVAPQLPRLRLVRSPAPLGRAAAYQLASQEAGGEFLVLLSCEAEVRQPDWLERLLDQAQRPEVGLVAPRLVNAKGKVTQAGLVLAGEAGVLPGLAGSDADAPGYLHRLQAEHNVSALSDACLMLRKTHFDSLGGFDARFDLAYADVDLSLQLGADGYLAVVTPAVDVIHPGVLGHDAETLALLHAKWGERSQRDALYNQNLSTADAAYRLGALARLDWVRMLGNGGAE